MTTRRYYSCGLLIALLFLPACDSGTGMGPQSRLDESQNVDIPDVDGEYIVVLKSEAVAGKTALQAVDEIVSDFSLVPTVRYGTALVGFAGKLTGPELARIEADPRVEFVQPDLIVQLDPETIEADGYLDPDVYSSDELRLGGSQVAPWGIRRVNGGLEYVGPNRAWIIDTGIDFGHPDLNVDVARSRSFLPGAKATDPTDHNGHGTHVAGTVAAVKNGIGVVGVAAGAPVVSVRVLNENGFGKTSWVVAGVDYVAANAVPGDAANMSLGGSRDKVLDTAVKNAAATGVFFSLAAGNSAADARGHSPARANGATIYTISAFAKGDVWASFSNYGNPPIDGAAPGVNILSTWPGGGYRKLNGTSMAAPHAAGLLLLGALQTDGTVAGDPDGTPDPILVH